MRSSCS